MFIQKREFICPYFPQEKIATFLERYYGRGLLLKEKDLLFQEGYRRFGCVYAKNLCRNCSLCKPLRIYLREFYLTPSLKKVLRKNRDLTFCVEKPSLNLKKKKLYIEYASSRHKKEWEKEILSSFTKSSLYLMEMYEMMYLTTEDSLEIQIWKEEELMGFGILDQGKSSLLAVYNVYSPYYPKRSLGIFLILKTIEWAKKEGFSYLYLGSWIQGYPKMDYKSRFPGSYALGENGWFRVRD